MSRIIIGAQHGDEAAAGCIMDFMEKASLIFVTSPAIEHRHAPPVRQHKSANIDRIGVRMFGEFSRDSVVANDVAARIAAHALDAHDLTAEPTLRGGLHRPFNPAGERQRHFAPQRLGVGDTNSGCDLGQLQRANRRTTWAEILIRKRCECRSRTVEIDLALAHIGIGMRTQNAVWRRGRRWRWPLITGRTMLLPCWNTPCHNTANEESKQTTHTELVRL